MRMASPHRIRCSLLLAAWAWALAALSSTCAARSDDLNEQVGQLVRQLNSDRAAQRDEAEAKLLALSGDTMAKNDAFLEALPEVTDRMPPSVRDRLTRIRQKVESKTALASAEATHVTIAASDMPLSEFIAALEDQTGNRIVDFREDFNQQATDSKVSLSLKDEPFWAAIDQLLDATNLGLYNFAGEAALALVAREEGAVSRAEPAAYSGPFRFEALQVEAQRNLRQPNQEMLRLQLEITWEPRLRPIALSQPLADLEVTGSSGEALESSFQRPVLDVEVQAGSQAAELIIPFPLPERKTTHIAKLHGKLQALVPGRIAKFRFDDLANAGGTTKRRGGVSVILDAVRQNNVIWEVHMRLRLDEHKDALQSHRTWPLQNLCFVETADGEIVDHVGFETTRQAENEVGLAYLFDLPDGIENTTWVYETPAAIIRTPVEYELRDIPLP